LYCIILLKYTFILTYARIFIVYNILYRIFLVSV